MFKFANPQMFWMLGPVALAILVWIYTGMRRRAAIRRFGDPATVARLMKEVSPRRMRNKFLLLAGAMVCLVFALARPQTGASLRETTASGAEIMFVVDVSNSMLAEDFQPNRLERTKNSIQRIIGELRGERIGLVVFAGDAYVQLPLTSDYLSASNFVSNVSTTMVSRQGTAIGAAIDLAASSFSSANQSARAMIVVSDGENHEDDPIASAREAAEKGIKVFTVGIGTPEGAPIRIGSEFIRDTEGNIVVSKLDERVLEQIAVVSGGAYIRAANQSTGISEIVKMITETDGQQYRALVFDRYNEHFRYFLLAGLVLLILECVMLPRRNRILVKWSIFR